MRQATLTIGIIVGFASGALADVTAPNELAFESGAVTESLTGVPGDPMVGRATMANRGLGNCIACHTLTDLQDEPFHGEIAPPLDGVGDRWSEAELRGIVANAKMTFDGSMMPSFYKTEGFIRPGDGYTGKAAPAELAPILTAQQVEDVVAYLVTLKE